MLYSSTNFIIKKYFYLLFIFLATNLYSMEISYDDSSDQELLVYKNYDLEKNANKSLDEFIKLLPRDVWLLILDYLDYKDNRKSLISFWAPLVGITDTNAKKMAIDLYRLAILNSESLKEWSKMVNNLGNNWKNQEFTKIIKKYLNILNKEFLDDIKLYKSRLPKFVHDSKYWDNKIKYFEEKYPGTFSSISLHSKSPNKILQFNGNSWNRDQKIYENNCILALLDLKKALMMYKDKKSLFANGCFETNDGIATAFKIIPLVGPFMFVLFLIVYLIPNNDKTGDLKRFISYALMAFGVWTIISIPFWYDTLMRDENYIPGFLKSKNKIENYLKTNKISFSRTDEHFLKILGHENRVEDIEI